MGGVGVSVVSTMWERREALHHTQLTEHVNLLSSISNQSIQGMMAKWSEQGTGFGGNK